jgi:limonene 1,2-monooxygenase
VTHASDWFELRDARLQLAPYSRPHVEMCVASQVSPAGARAAGKHGLGLLSIGATSTGGFNALAMNWQICTDRAAEFGRSVHREQWRLVGPMHVAETVEKARQNVRFGLSKWLRYFQEVAALPLAPPGSVDDAIDALVASGLAVIGDPEAAVTQLERLEKQSGGFGCFLHMAHDWADWAETKRSYELFARYVMPRFQRTNVNREASMAWATKNRPTFIGAMGNAINREIQRHVAEQKQKQERGA